MLARRPDKSGTYDFCHGWTVAKVVVVGATSTDMVVGGSRLPAFGETVLGGAFKQVVW